MSAEKVGAQKTETPSLEAQIKTREWQPLPNAGHTPFYHIAGNGLKLWLRTWGRLKIVGRENFPKNGGVLLASNHTSYLDPLMIGAALYGYRRAWLMGKSEMWDNRWLGWANDRVMGFPVKRNSADRATIRRVLDWLAKGEAVALFPEGERSCDGRLQPAQPGIALLVQKSGVPVVPMACVNSHVAWPRGSGKLKRVPLTIAFGEPLYFGPKASREEITTGVMAAIAALLTANGQPTEPPKGRDEA